MLLRFPQEKGKGEVKWDFERTGKLLDQKPLLSNYWLLVKGESCGLEGPMGFPLDKIKDKNFPMGTIREFSEQKLPNFQFETINRAHFFAKLSIGNGL